MRFLSKLSLPLARKKTRKELFKLPNFPETILPPLFQVSLFGKCWSASGLPDRRFARSSRFADWCSKKNFEAKSKLEYTIVFSSCKRSALPPPTTCWLPFQLTGDNLFFKTTCTAIIAHWALIKWSTIYILTQYLILSHTHTEFLIFRHLAVTRPLSSSSTWMIPDICHFFTWDIFVAFWTPESFFSDKYQLLFLDPSGCCLDCCSPALPSLSSHFSGLAQSRCRRFGGRV